MRILLRTTLLSLALVVAASATLAFPLNTSNTSKAWRGAIHSNGSLLTDGQPLQPMKDAPVVLHASTAPWAAASASLAVAAAATGAKSALAADLDAYSQVVQNIVRATEGDLHKIYDLIRNHVEFQPYFGFRKSPAVTWQSRRGNDADQALLLVQCLRAAGFTADFQYGVVILSDTEAMDWFGADTIAGLNSITGSAGYFGGSGTGIYGIEQIWCTVEVEGWRYSLAPAYKTYTDVAGIDIAAAMNYSQAGLLSAGGGTETATYVQAVSEAGVASYLADRAMDLVAELQTNHPTAAMDEVIAGRRMLESNLASDFSNGFYSADAFVTGGFDSFIFDDPYSDYAFNGSIYSFYAFLSLAIGEVNSSGDAFVRRPPWWPVGRVDGFRAEAGRHV